MTVKQKYKDNMVVSNVNTKTTQNGKIKELKAVPLLLQNNQLFYIT